MSKIRSLYSDAKHLLEEKDESIALFLLCLLLLLYHTL